jgi:lambda family phage portal protein
VAYWFHPVRPGSLSDWEAAQLVRVPAEQVCHLFRPLRPGQIRGLPHLTPALNRLRELEKFDDATLLRQQLAAMFAAFLKRGTAETSSVMPLAGDENPATQGTRPLLGLEPGLFQELEPGEEVQFSTPPDIIGGYAEYMRTQLRAACAGVGVPYEVLTGDLSGVNDRSVRVILHEFRRWLRMLQHHNLAFQVARPVWRAWVDRVFYDGTLQIPDAYLTDPLPWSKVQWMPESWAYLHPVQDIQAQEAAIRAGLSSRSAVVSEMGDDAEVIDRQQADDNARADTLGLRYDSDARQQKSSGAPTNAADPTPAPDPTPEQAAAAGGNA